MSRRNENHPELWPARFKKDPFKTLKTMNKRVKDLEEMDRNQWKPEERAEWDLFVEGLFRKETRTPIEKLIIDANARIMQLERHLKYQKKVCRLLQDDREWNK